MHPVLFELTLGGRPIAIGAYRFFTIMAMVAGAAVFWAALRRSGMGRGRTGILVLATAAAFPIGARFFYLITHPANEAVGATHLLAPTPSHFSLYGGLLASALTGTVLAKVLGASWRGTADKAVPALGASVFLAKTGCLLNGCCPGDASTLPWAVTLPGRIVNPPSGIPGALSNLVEQTLANPPPTHPIAAYEMLSALTAALLAAYLGRGRSPGTAFFAFIFFFSGARWLIFYLRTGQSQLDLTVYPLMYPAILLVSAMMLYAISYRESYLEAVS